MATTAQWKHIANGGKKSEIYFSLKYLVLILRKTVDLNLPLLGYKEHGATREKGFRNGKSYLLMPCAHTSLSLCVQHFTFTQQKPAVCLHGLAHTERKWRRKSLSHDIWSLSFSHSRALFMPSFQKAINDSSFDLISHQSFRIIQAPRAHTDNERKKKHLVHFNFL